MKFSSQIAKQFRGVHFGGNWTAVNLRDTLKDVGWQEATTKIRSFNTIAALVYHMNYYVAAVLKVLQGAQLEANDKYSFDHAPIGNSSDWENLLDKIWTDAEQFVLLVEQFPENKLTENFSDPKYGSWLRNLHGVNEHIHYHLGQIVLIKKIIRNN